MSDLEGILNNSSAILTPISIRNDRFLKLILLEQTPLLTFFGFVARPKGLVPRRIGLRKRLFLIDVGVTFDVFWFCGTSKGACSKKNRLKKTIIFNRCRSYF
jgi:hypothetical protein